MPEHRDRYNAFYTEHLWTLLPEVYRTSDSADPAVKGPLRELVERLGGQVAVVRRAIDRAREDQSIESCDDWVIPYIGELLATNLVAGLDGRAQRLDVARTIYYRRRKGTVALLEELTAHTTNWNARVVEFFRRLGRTRHAFDPPIGADRDAAVIGGLRGALSGTPSGGLADLRHAGAAAKAASAFGEFAHTADFRRGRATTGWHNIPKLGVFLWRLKSFGFANSTPVEDAACPGQFTFDPTGREIPLFARDSRDPLAYGDAWVTPDEWLLPGPMSRELFARELAHLYPDSVVVVDVSAAGETELAPAQARVIPERGRFHPVSAPAAGVRRECRFHHAFSSQIGAGPFERRLASEEPPDAPAPVSSVEGGVNALQASLAALGPSGTVRIRDSLTYDAVTDPGAISSVLLQAEPEQRPVVRLNGGEWTLQGTAGATLSIDGLLVTGADLVLRGTFDTVTLVCTTLDPGEEVRPDGTVAQSVDARPLRPVTLWIEGAVRHLGLRRCITGPIRTRSGGAVERITVTDSITQGVRTSLFGPLTSDDIRDPQRLARLLRDGQDAVGTFLRTSFSAAAQGALAAHDPTTMPGAPLIAQIIGELNTILGGGSIYTVGRFADVPMTPQLRAEAAAGPAPGDVARINRLLLEAAYATSLGAAAIACPSADISISRTTVLGRLHGHRVSSSESILHEFAVATDAQEGCIRFSAYVDGSILDQPYQSVTIADRSAIFSTLRFGQPDYAQVQRLADREVLAGGSIREGAKNGSEMGACSREMYALKERGLRMKLDEFMPIGMTPVLIFVT